MTQVSRSQKLLQLAEEPSSEKRRELLREITDIFLDRAEGHSQAESDHFAHLLESLSAMADVDARAELAGRVAGAATAPSGLINQLARDEITVAAPVLEQSPVLAQSELIEIVRSKGSAHQVSVARRAEVTEAVSSALVEVGHTDAVETLLKNAGARIDRPTMERAVIRSENEAVLQAPLVDRGDMPVDLLQDMFWFTSGDTRKKIVMVTSAAELPASPPPGAMFRAPVPIKRDSADQLRARKYIEKMKADGLLGRPLIIDLFKRKAYLELIIGFALLAEVREETALRILCDESGESLVLACKASGFDVGTFAVLAKLGTLRNPRSEETLDEMLTMFETMTDAVAKRVMRFWRVRETAIASNKPAVPVAPPAVAPRDPVVVFEID